MNTDDNMEKNMKNSKDDNYYPSAKIFYNVILNEYNIERQRIYNLDKKNSYLFLFSIIIFVFHFFTNKEISILIKGHEINQNIIYFISIIFPILYLCLFNNFINIYFSFKYNGISCERLNEPYLLSFEKENTYRKLIEDYQKILNINRDSNDEKYLKLKFSSYLLLTLIMLLVLEILIYFYLL